MEMEIKVLGPGCINCVTLERRTREALERLGCVARIEKITDIREIISYGIFKTPALVIDGKIVLQGRVLTVDELCELINKYR